MRFLKLEIAFIFSIGGPVPTPEPIALSPATSPQKLASIPNMRYSTKVHKVPQISRDEIIQMKKFADNDLDPMLQALIQKIMIARPADVMSFTMEQLNNMQNEKLGLSDGVSNAPKLDPIPAGSISPRSLDFPQII